MPIPAATERPDRAERLGRHERLVERRCDESDARTAHVHAIRRITGTHH